MDLTPARERLKTAYRPETFRQQAAIVFEELATYLQESQAGQPFEQWPEPERLIGIAREMLDRGAQKLEMPGDGDFRGLVRNFLSQTHRLHSPHYMGHQVAVPVPAAGLFESLGAIGNQGGAIYEMSPMSTAVEHAVVAKLGQYIGWASGAFDGFATHGGSLANLTALTTARNLRYRDFWEQGAGQNSKKAAILASADSHYSVARAAGILGLGSRHVVKVALDERRRMRADAAEAALARARADGLDVFCVVAACGSTPVGAFDPLDEIADFAARHKLWLHVDGCHGASVLLSRAHRALARGVEQVDSISWDAHKMLFVPALSTYLFYRKRAHSFSTFSQDAPYLFDPEAPGLSAYDSAIRTFECTKRSLAIGLWAVWSLYGTQLLEDLIDVCVGLGKRFHQLLDEAPDFEPVHEPQMNIVCFRHLPQALRGASAERVSAFQQALRRRLVESAEYYITSTRLDGEMVLRVTLINPLTDESHLRGLLDKLRALGKGLL